MRSIMTLGELISTLKRKDPEAGIAFDFVYFRPKGLHSYRGDYSQLAIGYTNEGECKVGDLLKLLEDAVGNDFTGYKGGEFTMSERTSVWVANPSEAGRTAIVDVRDDGTTIRLVTETHD